MADQQLPNILEQIHKIPFDEQKREQLFDAFYSDDPKAALKSIQGVPASVKQALFDIRGKIYKGEPYDLNDIVKSAGSAPAPTEEAAPKGLGEKEVKPEEAGKEAAQLRKEAVQRTAMEQITTVPKLSEGPKKTPSPFDKKKEEELDEFGRPVQKKGPKLVPSLPRFDQPEDKKTQPPPVVGQKSEEEPVVPGTELTGLPGVPLPTLPDAREERKRIKEEGFFFKTKKAPETKPEEKGTGLFDSIKEKASQLVSKMIEGERPSETPSGKTAQAKASESSTQPPPTKPSAKVLGSEKTGVPEVSTTKPPVEEVYAPSLAGDMFNATVRAIASGVSNIPKALSRLPGGFREDIEALRPVRSDIEPNLGFVGKEERLKEDALNRQKTAQLIARTEQKALPEAPISGIGQFTEATVSTVPYIAAGAVGGPMATRALGVAAGTEEALRRADVSGKPLSEGQRTAIGTAGAAIGLTEAIPLDRIVGRLIGAGVADKALTNSELVKLLFPKLKDSLKSGGIQYVAEGLQEGLSGLAQDAVESIYGGRKTSEIGKDFFDDLNTGGGAGLVIDILSRFAGSRIGRRRLKQAGIDPQAYKEWVESGDADKARAEAEEIARKALTPAEPAAPSEVQAKGQGQKPALSAKDRSIVEVYQEDPDNVYGNLTKEIEAKEKEIAKLLANPRSNNSRIKKAAKNLEKLRSQKAAIDRFNQSKEQEPTEAQPEPTPVVSPEPEPPPVVSQEPEPPAKNRGRLRNLLRSSIGYDIETGEIDPGIKNRLVMGEDPYTDNALREAHRHIGTQQGLSDAEITSAELQGAFNEFDRQYLSTVAGPDTPKASVNARGIYQNPKGDVGLPDLSRFKAKETKAPEKFTTPVNKTEVIDLTNAPPENLGIDYDPKTESLFRIKDVGDFMVIPSNKGAGMFDIWSEYDGQPALVSEGIEAGSTKEAFSRFIDPPVPKVAEPPKTVTEEPPVPSKETTPAPPPVITPEPAPEPPPVPAKPTAKERGGKASEDPQYRDAVRIAVELGKVSTSTLQRRLRVDYGRAVRILHAMQSEGIIGPPDGSRPREVLKRPDWIEGPPTPAPATITTPAPAPSPAQVPEPPPPPAPKPAAAKEAPPEKRIIIQRGMHDPVTVIFKDSIDKDYFSAVGKTKIAPSGKVGRREPSFEEMNWAKKRVAKDYGVTESKASKLLYDYHESVREQTKDLSKQDPERLNPESFDGFAKRNLAPPEPPKPPAPPEPPTPAPPEPPTPEEPAEIPYTPEPPAEIPIGESQPAPAAEPKPTPVVTTPTPPVTPSKKGKSTAPDYGPEFIPGTDGEVYVWLDSVNPYNGKPSNKPELKGQVKRSEIASFLGSKYKSLPQKGRVYITTTVDPKTKGILRPKKDAPYIEIEQDDFADIRDAVLRDEDEPDYRKKIESATAKAQSLFDKPSTTIEPDTKKISEEESILLYSPISELPKKRKNLFQETDTGKENTSKLTHKGSTWHTNFQVLVKGDPPAYWNPDSTKEGGINTSLVIPEVGDKAVTSVGPVAFRDTFKYVPDPEKRDFYKHRKQVPVHDELIIMSDGGAISGEYYRYIMRTVNPDSWGTKKDLLYVAYKDGEPVAAVQGVQADKPNMAEVRKALRERRFVPDKELWQMSQNEVLERQLKSPHKYKFVSAFGINPSSHEVASKHEQIVADAILEGKPVPQYVINGMSRSGVSSIGYPITEQLNIKDAYEFRTSDQFRTLLLEYLDDLHKEGPRPGGVVQFIKDRIESKVPGSKPSEVKIEAPESPAPTQTAQPKTKISARDIEETGTSSEGEVELLYNKRKYQAVPAFGGKGYRIYDLKSGEKLGEVQSAADPAEALANVLEGQAGTQEPPPVIAEKTQESAGTTGTKYVKSSVPDYRKGGYLLSLKVSGDKNPILYINEKTRSKLASILNKNGVDKDSINRMIGREGTMGKFQPGGQDAVSLLNPIIKESYSLFNGADEEFDLLTRYRDLISESMRHGKSTGYAMVNVDSPTRGFMPGESLVPASSYSAFSSIPQRLSSKKVGTLSSILRTRRHEGVHSELSVLVRSIPDSKISEIAQEGSFSKVKQALETKSPSYGASNITTLNEFLSHFLSKDKFLFESSEITGEELVDLYIKARKMISEVDPEAIKRAEKLKAPGLGIPESSSDILSPESKKTPISPQSRDLANSIYNDIIASKPNFNSLAAQPKSDKTQVATTIGSYKKVADYLKSKLPQKATILDYGAGLGLGTEAVQEKLKGVAIVEGYEPLPGRAKNQPKYTSPGEISQKYDAIVSLNVLNVLQPKLRAQVIRHIGSLLKDGGIAVVGTRGFKGDIDKVKNFAPGEEPGAIWVLNKNGEKEQYQKGFDGNELRDYVTRTLGSGFEVKNFSGPTKINIQITKKPAAFKRTTTPPSLQGLEDVLHDYESKQSPKEAKDLKESLLEEALKATESSSFMDKIIANTIEDSPESRFLQQVIEATKNQPVAFEIATKSQSGEMSTRLPKSPKSKEDPKKSTLVVGLRAMAQDENKLASVIEKMTTEGAYQGLNGLDLSNLTPLEAAQKIMDRMVDNLLWLHDKMPKEQRDRAKLWYDGAYELAKKWSKEYGISKEKITGVIAVLSPQKDWYQNAEMARKVIEAYKNKNSLRWNPKMDEFLLSKDAQTEEEPTGAPSDILESIVSEKESESKGGDKFKEAVSNIRGKDLKDLETDYEKAIWIRAYDQVTSDRSYHILLPEGEFGDIAKSKTGENARIAWQSYGAIAKAVSIMENDSYENISDQLGRKHKVRNFYNNILFPNSKNGHVTIDTHAVAAALLQALSASSLEVNHNFGGISSALTGNEGTYGLIADAYRKAAEQRGLLPREMQSITWEAIRGLFEASFKSQEGKAGKPGKEGGKIVKIWNQLKNNPDMDINSIRDQIFKAAGGITKPSWIDQRAKTTRFKKTPPPPVK